MGRRAGPDAVASQQLQIDLGADAVILGHNDGKAADHVLQNGQALFHMVLAVHSQLRSTSAGGHGHSLVRTGRHQRGSLNHGMSRSCAEAPQVGAGGPGETGNLRRTFGKVAAAPLIHIAASLFGAIDYVLYGVFADSSVLHRRQQRQNRRGLGDDVLMHYVGGEVHVNVVRAIHTANQFIVVIQALGMLFPDQTCNLCAVDALTHPIDNGVVHQRVGRQCRFHPGDKFPIQLDQIKHITGLHQQQKLLLGHDLAEGAKAAVYRTGFVIPGLGHRRQLFRGLVPDVNLIGIIGQRLLKAPDMTGNACRYSLPGLTTRSVVWVVPLWITMSGVWTRI